jgi:hypothetical protein
LREILREKLRERLRERERERERERATPVKQIVPFSSKVAFKFVKHTIAQTQCFNPMISTNCPVSRIGGINNVF